MKKFLSLVLAMIMTMSLVTISAGATEYKDLTDKDEIKYEEAVAVLNRIGVITGYPDGSFQPETELTRGAAAKIIVSLMIGPDAAAALPNTSSPYPDVPAGHTFAGVISYCKTKGYISGYGDGNFKPTGTLTGYAFAKMLLGALGYSSDIERFTGAGWTMNVANIGNVAGLFDRISFDGAAAVTRDEACQLALNTLKATMVTYGGTSVVNGSTGSYTIQGTQATPKTSNNRDINANIGRKDWYGGNNKGSDYLTLEFGEEHFKDLRLEHDRYDPAHDEFGRPSNEWSYKKVTIGTFPLEADYTFTTQVAHLRDTDGTKEKALGLRNYDLVADGGYSVWNGWGNDGSSWVSNGGTTTLWLNGKEDSKTFASKDSKIADIANYTDNGTLVEVYVSYIDADWITDVVVIQTQLMEVKKIGSDYVSLDRVEPDMKVGQNSVGFNMAAIHAPIEQVKDTNEDCYTILKDLKTGDEVAVIPVTTDDGTTWEAAEVYVPETVSGTLTRVDTYGYGTDNDKERGAISITVGGTEYKIANWNDKMWDIQAESIKATRKDVTLLMDKYGNAMLAKDVGATNNFMVIGNFYQALSGNKICTFVHGWDIGGEEVDLNLGSSIKSADHNGQTVVYGHVLGELVYYTSEGASGDADYVLKHADSKYNKAVFDVFTNTNRQNNATLKDGDKDAYEIKASNVTIPLADKTLKPADWQDGTYATSVDANNKALHSGFENIDRHTYYYDKGVKFIYVNYDGDDEIESVEFKSGVQNVSNEELRHAIMKWPSQAAVKDEKVQAVVIKTDSSDASVNRMLYVTDTKGYKEVDKDTNETFFQVEVAMFTADGKFLTEELIMVNKNLQIGDFATYTKVAGTKYEDNYYRVKNFTRHNSNPSVLTTEGVSKVTTAGGETVKHLLRVDKAFLIDGGELSACDQGSGASNNQSYLLGGYRGAGSDLFNQAELAERVINTNGALWLDATSSQAYDEVESAEDLLKLGIHDIQLDVLLNEKPDSDGFRSAYLIVIKEVGSSSGGSGDSSSRQDGTNFTSSYKVNEKSGAVAYTLTFTCPDWVPSTATVDVTGYITVDGIPTVINGSSLSQVNGKATLSGIATTWDADSDSEISFTMTEIKWSAVNVELKDAPEGVTLVTKTVPVGNALPVTITFTNPGTIYDSFKVSAKQGETSLMSAVSQTGGALPVTITLNKNPDNSKGPVQIVFSDVEKIVADDEPIENLVDETKSEAFTAADEAGLNAIKALGTGVYVFENLTPSNDSGSPFYQACDSKDTRVFVFDKDGSGEYTLKIGANGEYFTESFTAALGVKTTSVFNVQVSKLYSDVFHNTSTTDGASGSMTASDGKGTPLAKGEYEWSISGATKVIASGKIRVDGLSASESIPQTRIETPTVDTPDVPGGSPTSENWKDATDATIKGSPDGVYNFPVAPGLVSGTDLAIHGDQEDNFAFKFTSATEEVTFYMWDEDGELVEKQTADFSAGPHFFFFQLRGDDFANAGDIALDESLEGQNCEWRIVGSKNGIIAQGILAVPAEA